MDSRSIFSGVRDHYLARKEELPLRKRFHFFSRCFLWTGKPEYHKELRMLRGAWWTPFERIKARLGTLRTTPYRAKISSTKQYRSAAAAKYADIKLYNRYFFRCLFDRTLFGGTAFEDSLNSVDFSHLSALRCRLTEDTESVFALSTTAVNFITLSSILFGQETFPLAPEYFLDVSNSISIPDRHNDSDARVYFYTHVIIGASHFYACPLPAEHLLHYREMLRRTEDIVEKNYDDLSLDHKSEFLVCAQLCGYESRLRSRIHDELTRSLSSEGSYFVNTHNSYTHRIRNDSFSVMEHTNVLTLMAFLGTKDL